MKRQERGRRRPLVRLESNPPLRDGDRDRELNGERDRGQDGEPEGGQEGGQNGGLAGGHCRELNDALNALFAASWPAHRPTDFAARLRRSLLWVAAYRDDGPDESPDGGRDGGGAGQLDGAGAGAGTYREHGRHTARHVGGHGELVGFVNVVGDGGVHAFVLDTTVHPSVRGLGVGVRLVTQAADAAGRAGAEWLHVDYEEHLSGFYARCGFRPTAAGLRRLG